MDLSQKLEMARFLVDKGIAEAGLFYTRCSVFLAVQVVFAGYALKERPLSDVVDSRGHATLRLVSLVGFAMCIVWFFVNMKSIAYNRAWLADARRLISSDPQLANVFAESLAGTPGLYTPSLELRFWNWPASWWMQALVVFLGLFWILLPLLSLLGSRFPRQDE